MLVKASSGLRVPKEFSPRTYITDTEAVEVSESYYYTRLLNDGDLVLVSDAVSTVTAQESV